MTTSTPSVLHGFQKTWLWQQAFEGTAQGYSKEEQNYFKQQYLRMRERAEVLVSFVKQDIPSMTVHDITHLDALWEMASILTENHIALSPPEAFVLGGSILLHDAGNTLAAYPEGKEGLKQTIQWQDREARWKQQHSEHSGDLPQDVENDILQDVLRQLHAQQAEVLATQEWKDHNEHSQFLIEDTGVRNHFGQTIGKIAHSHGKSIAWVEREFQQALGAMPGKTAHKVDTLKIACLLRLADAMHLDERRASHFLRTLLKPKGFSAQHWHFQGKMATPYVEGESLVFTSSSAFTKEEADSWGLAYDVFSMVNQELQDVDRLLKTTGRDAFPVKSVKSIHAPEEFAKLVKTKQWHPVNARIMVSNVPKLVERFGGKELYGDDPHVPLRELIQNAADAIHARRKLEERADDWGEINISLIERDDHHWLIVEDNGIGMSELVLTGPLLDFGNSFWESDLALSELPGLASAGMEPIGKFGIGFFSVFMLGDKVRVISQRSRTDVTTTRVLEISGGPAGKPILYQAVPEEYLLEGGTRVEIRIKHVSKNKSKGLTSLVNSFENLLRTSNPEILHKFLPELIGSIAPCINVNISIKNYGLIIKSNDFITISGSSLLKRLRQHHSSPFKNELTVLKDSKGNVFGRAGVFPSSEGVLTVSGIVTQTVSNIKGVLNGRVTKIDRKNAILDVPSKVLSHWATQQARLIIKHNQHQDSEEQAKAAEIILSCGGDISDLHVAKWQEEWMSIKRLKEVLSDYTEVCLALGIDYEDDDPISPSEFKDFFEFYPSVIQIPKFNGRIIQPKELSLYHYFNSDKASLLLKAILDTISEAWNNVSQCKKYCPIGSVDSNKIYRSVFVLKRLQ